jgi:GAF domain-containing protein
MSAEHKQVYDLTNRISRSAIAVIDAITQRGGFKGEELSTIGSLRDQCVQAISLAEAYQQQVAEQQSQPAAKK